MENASKALIIVASIIISMVIVGLGVYFIGKANEQKDQADLRGTAARAFNSQFEAYFGNYQSASNVKNLIKTVNQTNIQIMSDSENESEAQLIWIIPCKEVNSGEDALVKNGKATNLVQTDDTISKTIKQGKFYKVEKMSSKISDKLPTADGTTNLEGFYRSGKVKCIGIAQVKPKD